MQGNIQPDFSFWFRLQRTKKRSPMIHNESEYQQAIKRIEEEKTRLADHCKAWEKQGFTAKQVKNLKEPLESFHLQLVEEVESYERLKRGQFDEF